MYVMPAGCVLLEFPESQAYNSEQKQQNIHKADIPKQPLYWGLFMS